MTTPCSECPFLIGSGFTFAELFAHASGEFPCHKACDLNDADEYVARKDKRRHCAGALIFNEKRGFSHQMMRICERLGFYDRRMLNMEAPVGRAPADYRREKRKSRKVAA